VSVFKNLFGERINSILLRDDRERIIFRTTEGQEFHYYTSGDCCNTVWINHMTGVGVLGEGNTFDLLRGALVVGAEDKGWGENRSEGDWDVIQDGFFTLKTDRGYIDFEVRNSHNGYYGGNFDFDDSPEVEPDDVYVPVVEDF
jgi:hypothetical protein